MISLVQSGGAPERVAHTKEQKLVNFVPLPLSPKPIKQIVRRTKISRGIADQGGRHTSESDHRQGQVHLSALVLEGGTNNRKSKNIPARIFAYNYLATSGIASM